jgi:hypothetical protein
MARAIVRLSLETGTGAAPRTKGRLNAALVRDGVFRNTGTGTWEATGDYVTLLGALDDLSRVLRLTDSAPIDHLWIYIDEPE